MSRYGTILRAFPGRLGGLTIPSEDPLYRAYTLGESRVHRIFDVEWAKQNSSIGVMGNWEGPLTTTVESGYHKIWSLQNRTTLHTLEPHPTAMSDPFYRRRALSQNTSGPTSGNKASIADVVALAGSPIGFADSVPDSDVIQSMLTDDINVQSTSFMITIVANENFTPQAGDAHRSMLFHGLDATQTNQITLDYRQGYGMYGDSQIRTRHHNKQTISSEFNTSPWTAFNPGQTRIYVLWGYNYVNYSAGIATNAWAICLDVITPNGTVWSQGRIDSQGGLMGPQNILDLYWYYVGNQGNTMYVSIASGCPNPVGNDPAWQPYSTPPPMYTPYGMQLVGTALQNFDYEQYLTWLRYRFLL